MKYFSINLVTEKEIYNGIFEDQDPDSNCLCFIRNIENLESNLNDPNIPRYIDIIKTKDVLEIDQDAKKILSELINEKLALKLNQENVTKFNVKWSNRGIENLSAYLESFGIAFYKQIIRLVDKAIKKQEYAEKCFNQIFYELSLINKIDMDLNSLDEKTKELTKEFKNFLTEISLHANKYKEITGKFFGRNFLTEKVI